MKNILLIGLIALCAGCQAKAKIKYDLQFESAIEKQNIPE